MTMSTGDPRRSAPQKSNPAATDDTDATVPEGPVGGVLPVKKTVRPGSAKAGSTAGRTSGNGTTRTGSTGTGSGRGGGANGTRAGKSTSAASKSSGSTSPTAGSSSASGTRAATKATPAKATATKATPTKTTAAKAASAKATPAKSSTETETPGLFSRKAGTKAPARPGGKLPTAFGVGKGGKRRPASAMRVAERRNWGPIALYVGTGVVALLIIGFGAWPLVKDSVLPTWQERAAGIPGIVNYIDPASPNYNASVASALHPPGDLTFATTPPAGGDHNGRWQNCVGVVYPAQIADEHAVHSLEHGAVWITYRPDLPQDQIDKLASRVRDVPYMMLSPHPGLVDAAISLQAWGYQLKVDNADDGRIGDFIGALRINAAHEEDAPCSGGITDASPTPIDLGGGV
jgi:hypothetical protein